MSPRKVRPPKPPTKVAHARIGKRTFILMRFKHESYQLTMNLHDENGTMVETINEDFSRRVDAVLAWMDACAVELTPMDDGN